jgi:hypothetical protein
MKQCALLLATIAVLSLTPHGLAADASAAAAATAPTQTVGKLTINGVGEYDGAIRDGKASGKGKLTFGDGRQYVGEFRDNKRYGQGTWTIGGFKYEGGWHDDSYHGQGTETYPKGLKYVGEFKDGYRCGQGTMTFPDGRKYEGQWKGNLFHGQGTLTVKDGKQQAGRWELGEYRGPAAAQPANAGGMDLPSELGDAPSLTLAVERLLREGTPAVRVGILRAIERVAGKLDLPLMGRLLIFGTTPAGAEHREAIEAIAATRAGGALDPAGLAALFDQVQKDKAFAARGIVEFIAEIYNRRCQRRANDFNALFQKGVDRLAALRAYAEKASTEGALDEWSNRVRDELAPSASSLVVWYTFDEGARDASPNGLHGAVEGTVSWEPGVNGGGAVGCRSGFIRLPDIRDRFATEATLSVWIKMDSGEALGQGIFKLGADRNEHYPYTDGTIYITALRNNQVSFKAPATVDRTKWHHLVVTHKPGPENWKCYINGDLIYATAGEEKIMLPAGRVLGHGGWSYAGGAFSDFRIYNRSLASNEVRNIYGQGVEPTAQDAALPVAVVDARTVWRNCNLEGPSCFLLDDPAPVVNLGRRTEIFKTAAGPMAKVGFNGAPYQWPSEATSLPPYDWASVTFDDSAWMLGYWPQPIPDPNLTGFQEGHIPIKAASPFDTVVVLARSRFEIKEPTRVKACRLSLDYWGGVVVYVNGQEVARGHLPGQEPDMLARLAEPYPEKVIPYRTPAAAAGSLRQLREVEIPAAFLRPGVNVLAVEAHPAPIPYSTWKRYDENYAWPAIGLKRARLTVAPADAAVTSGLRLRGLQVWNCAVSDIVTAGDDLREVSAPLRPVVIRAARNSVFSGRLVVGSDQTITGLTVKVSDLACGGAKLPAAAVRVRYAVPATPDKSWVSQDRFDGLLDQIPAAIPDGVANKGKALAPLWFTVRVPANVTAGLYEGRITIAAQGFQPQTVPIQVRVYDWILPDPREWRVQNFIYHAEEVAAKHYEVPNYSDKHFELVGKSLALLAELNSRQVQVNLVCDFFANGYSGSMNSNPESLVRWIKQPDGSFKHDFTNFDRYLEMVAKTIGKPRTLRLNCWGDCNPGRVGTGWISADFDNSGERPVTVLDPATGKLTRLKQPPLGTEENYRFWKPVFDEMLKKIKARGWLDETTLGYNAWFQLSLPKLVDEANRLWPGGEWSFTGHNGAQDLLFRGTDTNIVMTVRHADTVYVAPGPREPLWMLDKPRRNTFINDCRNFQREEYPMHRMRLLVENYGANYGSGYDGVGDFGADLFPLKRPAGGYYIPGASSGSGWASDHRSTLAILYPSSDGPVATERFEMLREGAELCEAALFVKNALAKKKDLLPAALQQRAKIGLLERDAALNRVAFRARFMPGEEDAKLLDLAGAVAQALAGGKPVAANVKGSDSRTPALPIAKNVPIKITGGTVSECDDAKGVRWTALVFTNNGTWEVAKDGFVDVLVVGGGGGGNSGDDGPGGGGAGGVIFRDAYPVTAGNYTVIVGDGGTGGVNKGDDGHDGGNSCFGSLTAFGGGGSGYLGGSGGGSSKAGKPGLGRQGMDGGCHTNVGPAYGGGGGGGFTVAGGDGTGKAGGTGGDGIDMTSWLGSVKAGDSGWFAGGGVGGTYDDAGNATQPKGGGGYNGSRNGMENSGGGGAGGRKSEPVAGNGGSGIVIVRFVRAGM